MDFKYESLAEELEAALDELTEKQRLFVLCYHANDKNGSQSVIMAGFKTKNPRQYGWELRQKPKVAKALEIMERKIAEDSLVPPEYVYRKIVGALEEAEKGGNAQTVLKAAEILARLGGMFVDRTEITGKDGGALKYEEVKNEADDFARSISRLAEREREGGGDIVPFPRSTSNS